MLYVFKIIQDKQCHMSNSALASLSICTGEPFFDDKVHVGRPNVGNHDAFLTRVKDALDRKSLSNQGPFVNDLEERIANHLDVEHVIATSSGTVSLEIAAKAMGLSGEVIVPSFTFVATPHALQWQGITPVFCDIDPKTQNIDPEEIESLITPRTTGILAVHIWGRPCEIEKLEAICEKNNLKLLFDASHAFGCSYKGRMIGNHGDAETFSFHATKFFNTFEGGAIATNDDELAERVKLMRNYGINGTDSVLHIGKNGKMNEISAAMGLTSLEAIDSFIASNKNNYQRYYSEFESIPGCSLIEYNPQVYNNYQYIVVEVDSKVTGLNRDQIVEILQCENVMVRRYFYPGCHELEPYKTNFPNAGQRLQETNKLTESVVSFPNDTSVDPTMISQICHLLRLAINNSGEVRQVLSNR